ncbi:hypothetical protein BYT27DRAFT_7082053, partial [Phlegmacium glaucopus]
MDKVESPSIHINELVALNSLGKSSAKSDSAGRLREPEPLMGKDPKKLKAFLFQCRLYFWSSSDTFRDDSKQVMFALSYLWDVAQEWFEPGISGLTNNPLDFIILKIHFSQQPLYSYITTNIEHELMTLHMKDSQCISKYLVWVNSLAVCCSWGESALRYGFYKGLP